MRGLAREDPHPLREAIGESKQGQGHAQAHEKSLLGTEQGLQGMNKEFEGKPKEGIEREKEGKEQDRLRILAEASLAQHSTS